MLKHLWFRNFKSWQEASIDFAPVTCFFGANSSGKSSLIQFLLLLKQSKDSPDRNIALDFGGQDSPVNLGSYADAIYRKNIELPLEWYLTWSLPEELRVIDVQGKRTDAIFTGQEIGVYALALYRGKAPVLNELAYHFDDTNFSLSRSNDKTGYALTSDSSDFKFIRAQGRPWELPGPTRGYAIPDQARTYFQNAQFLGDFELSYIALMDSLLHLGPLRDYPRREYTWAGSSPNELGRRGERWLDAVLAASARNEMLNRQHRGRLKPFAVIVAEWLKDLGLIAGFRVEELREGTGLYRVFVRRDAGSPETLITDVGFGVSQVLPALVLMLYAPRGSIVVLEQPEIHLHPAVQAALADAILNIAKNRGIQIIIESHSEHMLHRMLRRVAEGETQPKTAITKEDVQFYFCESKNGVSSAELLKVNMFGSIENWPKDFFGDLTGEIIAREKAAFKSKRAQSK